MKSNKATVKERNVKDAYILNAEQLQEKFPFLNFTGNDEGVFETKKAGYISARKLLQAQQTLSHKNGAVIIRDVVSHVERVVQPDGNYMMRVRTENGHNLLCKQVLLTTGAFTTLRSLLPGTVPEMNICPWTVAKVEVTEETAKTLRPFPPIDYQGIRPDLDAKFPRDPDGSVGFYMLPPIQYPDGKYYIKLGHFQTSVKRRLHSSEEIRRWYCEGNPQLARDIADFIRSFIRGINLGSYVGDYCVILETETDLPFIDMVHSQLGVAFGDNGHAAKSSDEIGRIAATMVLGEWESEIPKETFRLRLKHEDIPSSKL